MTDPDNPDEAETLTEGVLTPPASSPRVTGRPGAPPLFAAGSLLAERFRIVRFIAQGGMGEVYEAEDLELRERVALKTIGRAVADDERAMERFRREVQLSRRVTHANVCRLFEIFRQRVSPPDPARPDAGIAFLTMELLNGETLAERLNRVGRIAPAGALPIVTQIAAGLSAAHRAGVIHRDFKPGNVLLVPDPAEPGATRAVVTDFGLAHARAGEDEDAPSLTGSGFMAGTPAYIAPEQIEGGDITPATDLFAFGIVMYEMVTGTLPFAGHTPISNRRQAAQGGPAAADHARARPGSEMEHSRRSRAKRARRASSGLPRRPLEPELDIVRSTRPPGARRRLTWFP